MKALKRWLVGVTAANLKRTAGIRARLPEIGRSRTRTAHHTRLATRSTSLAKLQVAGKPGTDGPGKHQQARQKENAVLLICQNSKVCISKVFVFAQTQPPEIPRIAPGRPEKSPRRWATKGIPSRKMPVAETSSNQKVVVPIDGATDDQGRWNNAQQKNVHDHRNNIIAVQACSLQLCPGMGRPQSDH